MEKKWNKFIDHTLLKANATKDEITHLCDEAKQYDFASVCVNPVWVSYCAKYLADCDVKICTVIGFPLGANTSEVKAFEAKNAIENGVAAVGASVERYEYYSNLPAGDNPDPELTKLIAECAAEIVGAENVIPSFETSGGEDFFVYTVNRPNIKSGFVGLGVGAEPGMHHPQMYFDPKYLENGVQLHEKLISRILG